MLSLDLHANVTDAMPRTADAMVAVPHLSARGHGRHGPPQRRAAPIPARGGFPVLARRAAGLPDSDQLRQHPVGSGSGLYAALERHETADCVLTFAAGFSAADFPGCRPCVFGYGPDSVAVTGAVRALVREIAAAEEQFRLDALPAEQAVLRAAELVREGVRPVVSSDTQDNPGAGGDATSTGLLRVLLAADIECTVVAALWATAVGPRVGTASYTGGIFPRLCMNLWKTLSRGGRPVAGTSAPRLPGDGADPTARARR
ncbi:hypothetical protein HJ590_11135 [Naumannella sp. ID2617S]|nr:hypothetical protein [Naumannella sp. ID2617S]